MLSAPILSRGPVSAAAGLLASDLYGYSEAVRRTVCAHPHNKPHQYNP